MDSASPTVKRTAGRVPSVTGATFTYFGGTFEAETFSTSGWTRPRASGYRDPHHRPHGEGPLA